MRDGDIYLLMSQEGDLKIDILTSPMHGETECSIAILINMSETNKANEGMEHVIGQSR